MSKKQGRPIQFYEEPVADHVDISETVTRQCQRLLRRLWQTTRIPCEPIDVVRSCLPAAFWRAAEQIENSIEFQNLSMMTMWGTSAHLCLAPQKAWADGIQRRDLEGLRIFWVTTEEGIPICDDLTKPFLVPPSFPHYAALVNWHARAEKLQLANEVFTRTIRSVTQYVDSAAELRRVWPTLLNFVKLKGPTVQHIPKAKSQLLRRNMARAVSAVTLKKIEEQLAAATLLPDDFEPTAWVSFKT